MIVRILHSPGRNKFWTAALLLVAGICLLAGFTRPEGPKLHLSEYGFFTGSLAALQAAEGVFPYAVNAPLFSDYAEKARFIALPAGARMQYQENGSFEFPVGAVLIKNFYYPFDATRPEAGRRILETRLLLREESAWKALAYVWNAEQTEATLEVAGAAFPATWTDASGKRRQLEYQVPNLNQCKGCHSYDGSFVPLGLTAAQLNRVENGENQLNHWLLEERLDTPSGFSPKTAPQLADYQSTSASLELRARAYLDANCAHCHNPHGPASTSGLFLEATQTDPLRLGILKPPVAAGRGSGKRKYSIVPGKPKESILLYRMELNDPGIRMPELGRQVAHEEGLALIREWIQSM